MTERPYVTVSFLLFAIAVTFGAPVFDGSIYGLNAHPVEWLSFAPADALRSRGFPIFFSSFLHLGANHLFTNLFFFVPIALIIERKSSGRKLLTSFFFIHFLTLILLSGWSTIFSLEGKAFLGLSHIIIGLYSFWAVSAKKYSLFLLPASFMGIGFTMGESTFTTLSHGLGLMAGLLLVLGHHFKRSH